MKKRTIRPTSTNVLIEVLPNVTERPGSPLVLPESMSGRPNHAKVIAVGPKAAHEIEPGAFVVFDPYKLRLVFGDGALANASGTPVAIAGAQALIDIEHIHVEIAPDG